MKKISEMSKDEYIEHLEGALFDLLVGECQWYDIKDQTGCSEERCKEIETLFCEVLKKYRKKHGI